MTNAGKSRGEVDYPLEISKIDKRLAQIPHAEVSDLNRRRYVLQKSQVRSSLVALKDVYPDLKAVLLLRDHGSELFTDLDVLDYEALIEDDKLKEGLPFSKGWCLPIDGSRERHDVGTPRRVTGLIAGQVRHGALPRGLTSTVRSRLHEGFFGRMFRFLDPATFGANETENEATLRKLGEAMVAEFDAPKDGADEEEGGIPSLYTYLGQFVDHDITFDPASSLQRQNDPDALVDFRTPAFDLDCIYGRGPEISPTSTIEVWTIPILRTDSFSALRSGVEVTPMRQTSRAAQTGGR